MKSSSETPPLRSDAVVVGAGPAGLSAALRIRWVKGHGAIPFRVLLLDPAGPGGLASWKPNVLTGPHWRIDSREIPGHLMEDLNLLEVPLEKDGAAQINKNTDGMFSVYTAQGNVIQTEAVVLATGLRGLCDERRGFGSRVSVTFQGADRFPALLRKAARAAKEAGGPLVVIGHEKSQALVPLVEEEAGAAGVEVAWLLESGRLEGTAHPQLHGWPVRMGSRGESLWFQDVEGRIRSLPCGHVFIDYHAFELRPSHRLILNPNPEREPSGHLRTDRQGRTSVPGLFAAGDCTGPYYAIARALGDGVSAGLSAWRWLWNRRFGGEAPLFAYQALERPLADEARWIPPLPREFQVDVLTRRQTFLALAEARQIPGETLLTVPPTVGAWEEAWGKEPRRLWEGLFDARAVTVRPPECRPVL